MKLALYIKKARLHGDPDVASLVGSLRSAGCLCTEVAAASEIAAGTEMLLSLGGDGTFLDAAQIAVEADVPVLGLNFGRMGFLSESNSGNVVPELLGGNYILEERSLLQLAVEGAELDDFRPLALNEICLSRIGPAMLGVDVSVNGLALPAYWADGLLVATSSGSTAYSLSVGGPICIPDSKVQIIAPVSPHNLNVRPLIVSEGSEIDITFKSRSGKAILSMDNRNHIVPEDAVLHIRTAGRPLRRVRFRESNFISALRSRLLWGADVRNAEDR